MLRVKQEEELADLPKSYTRVRTPLGSERLARVSAKPWKSRMATRSIRGSYARELRSHADSIQSRTLLPSATKSIQYLLQLVPVFPADGKRSPSMTPW